MEVERDGRLNFGFTSRHTLRRERDVVQGDICPHVSAYFCLEGHSERSGVGQDDICVRPLVTMVSCGCPHQQTGATGSNSIDLSGCKTWDGTCYISYYPHLIYFLSICLLFVVLKLTQLRDLKKTSKMDVITRSVRWHALTDYFLTGRLSFLPVGISWLTGSRVNCSQRLSETGKKFLTHPN